MNTLKELSNNELLEYLEDFKRLGRQKFYERIKKELEKRNIKINEGE